MEIRNRVGLPFLFFSGLEFECLVIRICSLRLGTYLYALAAL